MLFLALGVPGLRDEENKNLIKERSREVRKPFTGGK